MAAQHALEFPSKGRCPGARFWFARAGILLALIVGICAAPLYGQDAAEGDEGAARRRQFEELAAEAEHLQRQANVLRKVVQLAKPSVVHIDSSHSESSTRFGRRPVEEAGSGTVFVHEGRFYVLTNRHVVKGATTDSIKIRLADGREITPLRVLADPETDVAVMPVEGRGLVPARIGDSDIVDIGDFVLAVGSPFGLSHSVTFGIISAKGRRDLELGEGVRFQDFMQTDAAINPGNSGGPLLNLRGEVIGMNTAIASSSGGNEGIGFTIPINMVMIIAKQLIENNGVVNRAYLGVNLDSKFTPVAATKLGLQRPRGAHVSGIVAGSPAEIAELRTNDVILEFDGVPVDNDSHLVNLVSLTEVGKEVPVLIFRDGKTLRLTVKVGNRAAFPAN